MLVMVRRDGDMKYKHLPTQQFSAQKFAQRTSKKVGVKSQLGESNSNEITIALFLTFHSLVKATQSV